MEHFPYLISTRQLIDCSTEVIFVRQTAKGLKFTVSYLIIVPTVLRIYDKSNKNNFDTTQSLPTSFFYNWFWLQQDLIPHQDWSSWYLPKYIKLTPCVRQFTVSALMNEIIVIKSTQRSDFCIQNILN